MPIIVWNSMGNFPPSGLLDGRLHDAGSYYGCLDLSLDGLLETNHTSYCTLSFRPLIPSRPKYHAILNQLPHELIDSFARNDVFNKLAKRAHYHHYIYIKTAICVPYDCSAYDAQLMANRIAQRMVMTSGPVKCLTREPPIVANQQDENVAEFGEIENHPLTIYVDARPNSKQRIVILLISLYLIIILMATVWHFINYQFVARHTIRAQLSLSSTISEQLKPEELKQDPDEYQCTLSYIALHYFSILTNAKELVDVSIKPNEIHCIHLIRVVSMFWIMLIHSLQYNDWSGFERAYETEHLLTNPLVHPFVNGNYLVDNFFLISGLMVYYNQFTSKKANSFHLGHSLISRYLRLTPQVLIVSMLYIVAPLIGHGPFWYDAIHDASKHCENNWWINLFHIQAFYKTGQICNLVSWWISVDMFLHIIALSVIHFVLNGRKALGFTMAICLTIVSNIYVAYQHYTSNLPPHNLSVIPQVAENWTDYVVNFSWSPWPHVFPYMFGLWLGKKMALNEWKRYVNLHLVKGTFMAISTLILTNTSSSIWTSGWIKFVSPNNHQSLITLYNLLCPIIWTMALSWLIVVCHYGHAVWLNRISTYGPIVIISRVSFIVYLSHLLVIRAYFGLQTSTISLSFLNMIYQILANINLSIMLGIFLYITFELPMIKLQRVIMNQLSRSSQINNSEVTLRVSGGNSFRLDKIDIRRWK